MIEIWGIVESKEEGSRLALVTDAGMKIVATDLTNSQVQFLAEAASTHRELVRALEYVTMILNANGGNSAAERREATNRAYKVLDRIAIADKGEAPHE